jgi:hypothetical protein
MRKERVYYSMLSGWRKQVARSDQAARAVRWGPKVNPATAQKRRDEQLHREIARLTRQLARATASSRPPQKKLCTLLGLPVEELSRFTSTWKKCLSWEEILSLLRLPR